MKLQMYKLRVPDETTVLVRSLHPNLKRKIKAALQTILTNPQAGKALKDELAGMQSFRVGKFRVIYRIKINKERVIEIVAIGPRKKIYEETLRLLRGKN
jgi:mRNA interferase RelE/StbE